ncbi:MAG: metallo-mystery pair system four-Cys motif protein [Leptospiraceae bacterium]|nr:metallo-mystery pair system four-Cys motif protein [Leptospiraceae bacterium]
MIGLKTGAHKLSRKIYSLLLTGILFTGASGCTGNSDGNSDALFLLLAASLSDVSYFVEYDIVSGGQSVRCGSSFTVDKAVNGSTTKTLNPYDLRFYVSNVRFLVGNSEHAVTLPDDGAWQYGNVALLDFENATGNCTGTSAMNSTIHAKIPAGTYDGIAFDLGVSESMNQLNNGTAPSPLNINQMYWSWSLGYKFTKIEFRATDATYTTQLHLGSLDCGGDVSSNSCAKPYRSSIKIVGGFQPGFNKVTLDLNEALSGFNPSSGTRMGCMPMKPPAAGASTAEELTECPKLLGTMGVDATSGVATGSQSAFMSK